MTDVTLITPIGRSFWSKLDGSIDAGFNYTRSSGIAQLNFNWDSIYRKPASSFRLSASFTLTEQEDEEGRDDRGFLELSYLRSPWRRWFFTGQGRFETNASLGLDLRSQVGGAIGPRLVNSARARAVAGAGVVVNDERKVDAEAGFLRRADPIQHVRQSPAQPNRQQQRRGHRHVDRLEQLKRVKSLEEAIEWVKPAQKVSPNGETEIEICSVMDIEDSGDAFTPNPEIEKMKIK